MYNLPSHAKKTDAILISLIVLDVVIFTVAFFFPDLWTKIFHGEVYVESYGLLRRTASLWAAFALFQTIALFKWKKNYIWLALVAGLRFSEIFSDWVYLGFCQSATLFAWLALSISPPANIIFGLYFFKKSHDDK